VCTCVCAHRRERGTEREREDESSYSAGVRHMYKKIIERERAIAFVCAFVCVCVCVCVWDVGVCVFLCERGNESWYSAVVRYLNIMKTTRK